MADRGHGAYLKPHLNLALVVIACLGLAVVLYSTRQLLGNNGRGAVSTPENSHYYVDNPVTYKFNTRGRLVYKLVAKRSLYFHSGAVRITLPEMHYYPSKQGHWHFQAQRGYIPPGHKRIRLNDHVNAVNHKTGAGTTHIHTSEAWVIPDKHLVTSKKHVVARNPSRRLTGRGMRLNIQTNHLKVRNNAHVTYHQ